MVLSQMSSMSHQREVLHSRRGSVNSQQPNDLLNATITNSRGGNERTPLITSIGPASESFLNNSVVAGNAQVGVSWTVAVFLLVNTALGAGMLNYPYAYNQIGGVLAATLMQLILLVFVASTMLILIYCADINQDSTYHDVLLSMCGKRAQQLAALSILLTCYGINITFLVIIGDQYDRIFNSLLPEYVEQFWYLDRKFTIFMTSVLFIWPMCYAQRLDFLRHASLLGMFAMLYVAFLTVYEHYQLDDATTAIIASQATGNLSLSPTSSSAQQPVLSTANQTKSFADSSSIGASTSFPGELRQQSTQWFVSLAIVPVLCFAYQTHEVIVPVYACMRERRIGQFIKASFFGLVILFLLYNLVGAYGYLTFGENVGPDIISLYDAQDPIVVIGVVALVIKFITTYPPLMFCGRSALDGLYGEIRKMTAEEFKSTERVRRIVITTLWFFSTVALAIFAPDISVTLQLLGSMASVNVFVFPGMCLVSLTRRLRQARVSLLMGEVPADAQQKAKDYYLISGSYMMKKNGLRNGNFGSFNRYNGCGTNVLTSDCLPSSTPSSSNNTSSHRTQQHFTATFASLMEFENAYCNHPNGDCMNNEQQYFNDHSAARDLSLDKSGIQASLSGAHHQCRQQNFSSNAMHCLQSSWQNNRSTAQQENILDRLGSSIAPSTVAQIGISRFAATGLYLFSALLIAFGVFIFVLEIISVSGLLQ